MPMIAEIHASGYSMSCLSVAHCRTANHAGNRLRYDQEVYFTKEWQFGLITACQDGQPCLTLGGI